MTIQYHDLETYTRNSNFYSEFSILATVKSFDLLAIRKRYLATKHKKSNRTGSVERREVAIGGIVQLTIKKGKLVTSTILAKMPEPRGIHVTPGSIALSSENRAFIIENETIYTVTDDWLSYIHTVQINEKNPNTILISSSGFDAIFEFNYKNNQKIYEWFAWENGFNAGFDPATGNKIYLTRLPEIHKQHIEDKIQHLYISDPKTQTLPTARRAAFINSVVYSNKPETLLATFFHEGAVFEIEKSTGKATRVLDKLKNPHGGQNFHDKFMATSTAQGELVIGDTQLQHRYQISKLSGKPVELADMEWIQNSIKLDDNFICIDSNRNAFIIFNPEKRLIDLIPYDSNWAIQDITLNVTKEENVKQIKHIIENNTINP